MKKILKGAFVALLMLIIVSCSFSEKEADVYATVDTPTVIYGTVGTPNTYAIPQMITITLHNGTLSKSLTHKQDITAWVQNYYNIFSNFSLSVLGTHNIGDNQIRLYVNQTNVKLNFTKETNERLKIQIPADYIKTSTSKKDRISPVVVNTDNLKVYSVHPNGNKPLGRMISSAPSPLGNVNQSSPVNTSGLVITGNGRVGDEVNWDGRIEIENTTFKASEELKAGKSIKGWFSPEVKGIDYIVKEDVLDSSAFVNFTMIGTVGETKPQTFYTVKVPGSYTYGGTDVPVNNLANAFVYITVGPSRLVVPQSQIISGTVSLSKPTVDNSFVINAIGGSTTFKALSEGDDVSSWFSPIIPGLNYTVSAVTAGDTNVTVRVSGTPERSTTHDVEITVPASAFINETKDITVDGTIKYNIEKSTDFEYDWKLYDLASFGAADLSSESPNKALTKAYNGTDELTFVEGNMLATGSTNAVSFQQGLSRRGYKLVGFNRVGDNGLVSTRTEEGSIDFAVDKDVTVGADGAISFNLNETDKGDVVRLYAIWDVDLDAWHLKKNPDGSYNTTLDISLNADGKNEYLPAVFDVEKAYPNDAAKEALYHNYPYYRESVVLSKGLSVPGNPTSDYADPDSDITLDYDFAIGEQVITGYMLDELRTWNATLPESDRYTLPTQTETNPGHNAATDTLYNVVGYGATFNGSDYTPNNDKSEPITFVTVPQGMVIANAMTAYYNAKKGLSSGQDGYLDAAYIVSGGTEPIKKISEAVTLYNATTTVGSSIAKSGAKGFRLPTSIEWGLAARIVPESGYDKSLTGAHYTRTDASKRFYMYPQITRSNMWSGSDIIPNELNNNPLADTWVWYAYNSYGKYGELDPRSSHGFLKNDISTYARKEGWSVLDKKQNNIGVYGMSGNVWEWCDTVTSSGYLRLRGGSFASIASDTRVGFLYNNTAFSRSGNFGLRLARLI